jgi:Tfp pilus assembly protein FimT
MPRKVVTLIEMMVVVAVVSIVGIFSASFVASRRLQQEISLVRADLGWVRERAVCSDSDYCVRFFDANTYQIFRGDCATGSFIKEVRLRSSIINPTPSFDVIFYTFDSSYPAPGGVAYSKNSSNKELVITLQQQTRTGNLRDTNSDVLAHREVTLIIEGVEDLDGDGRDGDFLAKVRDWSWREI